MIICLIAKAGGGKDTAAAFLQKTYNFQSLTIARPIKNCLMSAFNVEESDLESDEKDTKVVWVTSDKQYTCRDLMKVVGETFKEKFGLDHWIKLALIRLSTTTNSEGNLQHTVVTDVRFPIELEKLNEYAALNQTKLIIVRITGRGRSGMSLEHQIGVSENALNDVKADYTIDNSGKISELYAHLDYIVIKNGLSASTK
jgi:dephospho-CoA kinase